MPHGLGGIRAAQAVPLTPRGCRFPSCRGEAPCPMGGLTVSSPPPVLEKIRSAVGSAQLLMSQKVQQFYRLCQQNMVSARDSHGGWGVSYP